MPVPGKMSPAKKYKLYKNSINKSIHFAQRSLSNSTRGQRVTNLSDPMFVPGKKLTEFGKEFGVEWKELK